MTKQTTMLTVLALLLCSTPASASWLADRIDGVRYALQLAEPPLPKSVDGDLAMASAAIGSLPASQHRNMLAAEGSAEGHWTFRNAAGETATAADGEEMAKVLALLRPAATSTDGPPILVISSTTLWRWPGALHLLPEDARLRIAHGHRILTLIRGGDAVAPRLTVEARANVLVRADDQLAFRQAMAILERPIWRGTVRLLTLEPGAPRFLPGLRPRAADAEMPRPEAIDPYKLRDVFRSIAGSTALVTGAVDGKYLLFEPADGGEQSLLIEDMRAAAVTGDVDLVIFDAGVSQQPGVRNLLWQRSEVVGFAEAVASARYGDFLAALGQQRGRLILEPAAADDVDRFNLAIRPAADAGIALPKEVAGEDQGMLGSLMMDAVTSMTGELLPSRMFAYLRSDARQRELDRRIIPGVPSEPQWIYAGMWLIGLFCLPWLWPAWRRRSVPRGSLGLIGRAVALVVFATLALPAALVLLPLWRFSGRVDRASVATADTPLVPGDETR